MDLEKEFCPECKKLYDGVHSVGGRCPSGHILLHDVKCKGCGTKMYYTLEDDFCGIEEIYCPKCVDELLNGNEKLNLLTDKENWKIGNHPSVIVSDKKPVSANFPEFVDEESIDEVEYYGGYLICESVANDKHAKAISATLDLLEFAQSIENDDGSIPDKIWQMRNNAIKKATKQLT